MKPNIITTTLVLAIAGSITAAAQEGDRPGPPREGRGLPPQVLEKFDKDGDGKLNEEERKAAREAAEAKRKEILEKYDADGDGRLSPEERKAAIDAGEDIPARPMRRPGARGEGRPERGEGRPGPEGRRGPNRPAEAPDA